MVTYHEIHFQTCRDFSGKPIQAKWRNHEDHNPPQSSNEKPAFVIFCCPKCNYCTHVPLLTSEKTYVVVLASPTENPTQVKMNRPDPTQKTQFLKFKNPPTSGENAGNAKRDPTRLKIQKPFIRETMGQTKKPRYTWAEKGKWTNNAGLSKDTSK